MLEIQVSAVLGRVGYIMPKRKLMSKAVGPLALSLPCSFPVLDLRHSFWLCSSIMVFSRKAGW
mgnify:CR=1 FL=1